MTKCSHLREFILHLIFLDADRYTESLSISIALNQSKAKESEENSIVTGYNFELMRV